MSLTSLLHTIQDRLFGVEDSVCLERAQLVTEAHRMHSSEPIPIMRAKCFAHILDNMTLDMESNPVFAGNTSTKPRGWMLVPEFGISVDGQVAIEHDMGRFLVGKVPEEIRAYWNCKPEGEPGPSSGAGHLAVDYDRVVNRGLKAIIEDIDRLADEGSEAQRTYRKAMRISCEAVMRWAGRYSEAAIRAAENCDDPVVADCHRRVAEACRRVPAEAARNLFEGLQAIALAHLAIAVEGQGVSISIGLPDRVLARFASEAEADPERARDLASAFILKIAANSWQGRSTKTQAITVGGADSAGADRCNGVTRAFLEAFARTPVSDPHLFVRWHRGIDSRVWAQSLDMLAGARSMPLLVNDHEVAPALEEAGVRPDDAWSYCIIGCNELGIPGRSTHSAMPFQMNFNDLRMVDRAMRECASQAASIADIVAKYESLVEEFAETSLAQRRKSVEDLADKKPFPFSSACCEGTVDAGDDLLRAMPYSNLYALYARGTSNAVNALSAVEEEVFRKCRYSLKEYLDRIDMRDQTLLDRIAAAPKWGNDDESADQWAMALNEARDRAARRVAQKAGMPPFPVCHVVRSLHHLDGKHIGATADGRPAGEAVADSIGAVFGTARKGPTALLNSMLKIRSTRWFGGIYNLNLTLPEGEQSRPEVVRALAEGFFLKGGQELQINVLNAARLRDAQQHPERYRDLIVRVAGLNARFVELSALEQEEIIRRAEAAK